MRTLLLVGATAVTIAITANAQSGDILNRAKGKIDDAQQSVKPVTDRGKRAAETFNPWSAKDEQEIGEAGAAKMIAVFGLVDNEKVVRYVNLVVQAVGQFASRHLPLAFEEFLSLIAAAFSLPGGCILISRAALSG